ncbi:helix-turn-helix transcriptional regulator [Streptomyces sp. NPDC001142]
MAKKKSSTSPHQPLPTQKTSRSVVAVLDVLFPRDGAQDLADLRCDAGFSQGAAADEIKVVNRFRLGAAERGRKRLDEPTLPAVAAAYGVTVEELSAAQDRSFGETVPLVVPPPLTLAEKLNGLIRDAFPEGDPPGADVAAAVNARVGSEVVTAGQVEALLVGTPPETVFAAAARRLAFEALGLYFGVSPLYFQPAEAERRVLDDIRYLAERHQIELAARGGEAGVLSDEVVAVLNGLLANEARVNGQRQSP